MLICFCAHNFNYLYYYMYFLAKKCLKKFQITTTSSLVIWALIVSMGEASHSLYYGNGNQYEGNSIKYKDYMFGYGVNSNENNERQNFGQKEHRTGDEVIGEW